MKHFNFLNRTFSLQKIVIICLHFFYFAAQAQELKLGFRFQKTQTMYWENGLTAQYSFRRFNPNQFFVGFDFVTSRLGTAIHSNAIKQDNYLLSSGWQFCKKKPFHFIIRLNIGFFYANLEEDIFKEIPNTSLLFSPELGFAYDFKNQPISLNLGTGYYIFTEKEGYSPGTLQPLFYHFDVHYRLKKNHK